MPATAPTPADERDACGIGFVAQRRAGPSHAIVDQGLHLLERLEHRGACGCDGTTGDGAGLLLPIPDAFLRGRLKRRGIDLPAPGQYGVATLFVPHDDALREACVAAVEAVCAADEMPVLAWRRVPTDASVLGASARETEPAVLQCIVKRPPHLKSGSLNDFDRSLYLMRRGIERRVARRLPDADVHVASCSAQTVVYKGMLTAGQLRGYYPELSDPDMQSRYALVHARFSTNTLPRWSLAQPFRRICHNGEINTLRGNVHRMQAREALLRGSVFDDHLDRIRPVVDTGGSDSSIVDSAVELLVHGGRSLEHVLAMMVPEAWEHNDTLSPERRAFYRYHACLMEPWDGPAAIAFGDGRQVGALLDRSGLRPARYTALQDGRVVLASEAGALENPASQVEAQGRLGPGRMLRVNLEAGRLETDDTIKDALSRQQPYRTWVETHLETLKGAGEEPVPHGAGVGGPEDGGPGPAPLRRMQQVFGYTQEDLRILLAPMGEGGSEAIGSMGDDTPLAVLSDRPRLLYDHFRQLFAQVTNPPLDAIREKLVTGLDVYLGSERSVLAETPDHARRLHLEHPIVRPAQLEAMKRGEAETLTPAVLDATFPAEETLASALQRLSAEAEAAVREGASLLVLSDRRAAGDEGATRLPIPMLLAVGGVHHPLLRSGQRIQTSLLADSAEPREVHHLCTLLGYGADAICPYGALATIREMAAAGRLNGTPPEEAVDRYEAALTKGILKVMSKMGISTLQSYCGAQIFEIVGLADDVVDPYFSGTVSRLGGVGLEAIENRVRQQHRHAHGDPAPGEEARRPAADPEAALDVGGRYQWRKDGERHALSPSTIASLQHATRSDEPGEQKYREYAEAVNQYNRENGTLRGLLRILDANGEAVPVEAVEPWTEIVKRFKTGAMSYGSISEETHTTLAEAMNELGGKSNTGEGGEHPDRYPDGHPARSRIKQIASGRFGVTLPYLDAADEIQIKMAQGAKPGEGGQLPGEKVYPWIAEVRHSTPGVPLISPPPHHDIYSIEDLAQLIFDLKNANPDARVSVKLVSAAGVGTIAAGVAKAKADHILISGHSGGTGASPQGSIMHAGLPWEMGIAEAHQMLVKQGLRRRVTLEADGGLRTGRDVALAALLGAQEFGFSTAPLISLGCIMMRKCHLNTCPVGIATQDPELREKFDGRPEHVVNYFYLVAQEVRKMLARLGMKSLDEMVGRVDRLQPAPEASARGLDLSVLLKRPTTPAVLRPFAEQTEQDHDLDDALDHDLIARAAPAWEKDTPVALDVDITNRDRTVGTLLSRTVIRHTDGDGLPDDTITLRCQGTAGQSFAAFAAPGITFDVRGQANDYLGKGLSGAHVVLQPPEDAAYAPEDAIVAGNVALYGATSGRLLLRGRAGERFAVRNSGAMAVVEGVGDHGCEYMTGGCVVVLGPTGRNFAAGMSGGIAYVWDPDGAFARRRCNRAMVDLEAVAPNTRDAARLRALVEQHHAATQSPVAARVLRDWPKVLASFVKVFPTAFKEALAETSGEARQKAAVPVPTLPRGNRTTA